MIKETVLRIFRDPPELYTKRLLLRRMKRCDSADMFAYASKPEVTRYLTWTPHPDEAYTMRYLTYIAGRYRAGDFFDWSLILREEGKMIGTCGFTRFHFEANAAEVGYVLHPGYWGRGLATEALRAVMDFGFRKLNAHRIEARYMEGNERSRAVMERCGMQYEGIQRDVLFTGGRYVSVGTCAILSQEYLENENLSGPGIRL